MKFSTKKKITIGLLGLTIYTIPLLTMNGALFLKSEGDAGGLKGEVTTKGYEGWIAIDSFQIGAGVGVSFPSGSSNREISAPSFSEMTITKSADKTSTGFFSSMTAGTNLPELRLFVPPLSNPGRFIKIYLKNVLVSGVSWSSGGEVPSESVSLNYEAIKIEHYTVDSLGAETKTGEASWNLATQKAGY
jgi:type VI secretion system secreted protein Hcp